MAYIHVAWILFKKKRRVFPHIQNFSEDFQVIFLWGQEWKEEMQCKKNAICIFPTNKTEST